MPHNPDISKIGAVVVLFNPDLQTVLRRVPTLLQQVGKVCFVDNTPQSDLSERFAGFEGVTYIPLKANCGIAKAQNTAIRHFLPSPEIEYLLFLDQDSELTPQLASRLLEHYTLLSKEMDVIAIGPQAINADTHQSYVWQSSVLEKIERDAHQYWLMRNLPSSYSLSPKRLFADYGMMDERLFIDGVEHEWYWRMKSLMGGKLAIVPELTFEHQMGTPITFMGRRMSKSVPFRLYYQVRNVLWMRRLDYVPKSWKRQQLKRLALKCVWYPIFIAPRGQYLKSIARGLRDGIFKRLK